MRVIVLAVAGVLGVAAPAVASVGDVEHARARVLTSDYQTELPGSGSAAYEPDPRRRDPRMWPPDDDAQDTRDHRAAPEGAGALAPLINLVLWGLLIVGVTLCVFWLVAELMKYTEDVELPPDEAQVDESAAITAAVIDRPLGDAEELARQGELSEAIHTLLLRTLQELVRSAAVRVERSHTSREILARVPLLADAREALADLITAVELTHFGDEPATATDYERCRRQFHRFAEAFRATGLAPQRAGATR